MSVEMKRNGLRPPSTRHIEAGETNGNKIRQDPSKLRQPGFGKRNTNTPEAAGRYDNREENGNVQLRQAQTRGFGFRKTVAVNKSVDVRSSLPVQGIKPPTPRGSQTSVNSAGVMQRSAKTSSVPVIGKSKKPEFERSDLTRGSYRKIEEPPVSAPLQIPDGDIVEQGGGLVVPDSPKKKSLLSRFGFKSSSFRLKNGLFKNEQPAPSVLPVSKKASTLPQNMRAPEGDGKHGKSRSPVRKFAAKRFSFIDGSRNKCSDSRSSSFEIISDLSPDAMNAALKRPSIRPQVLPRVEYQNSFKGPGADSGELSGPFLAMIISDGQCRLEQRVNDSMAVQTETEEDVIYENQDEYLRQSRQDEYLRQVSQDEYLRPTSAQDPTPAAEPKPAVLTPDTPRSESIEVRPYIETDIDSHSYVVDEIFATTRVSSLHQDTETSSIVSTEIEPGHNPCDIPAEWNSSEAYQPARAVDVIERHSESSCSASHSSRERDFLIDDEIIDQPSLVFTNNKAKDPRPFDKDNITDLAEIDECQLHQDVGTPDENNTLSACDSIKSESLEAWFRFIENDNYDIEYGILRDGTLDETPLALDEGMKFDMAPSNGSCEGVISTSESSTVQDMDLYFGEDIVAMKMLLLRLRNMLLQAETCNPFESKEKNGFYRQLALSDSRQNLSSLDSMTTSADLVSALNEEILDLKRERILLKEQLEEKDRIIKQLQTRSPRRNGTVGGEAKWNLPPSGRKAKSERKSEKMNVATQTDRVKLQVCNGLNSEDTQKEDSSDDRLSGEGASEELGLEESYIPAEESHCADWSAKESPLRETKIPKGNSLKVLPTEVHPSASGKFMGGGVLSRLSVNAK